MISPLSVDPTVKCRRPQNHDFQRYAIMNGVVASTNHNSFDPLITVDLCKPITNPCEKRA
jgi:hypothetical protein